MGYKIVHSICDIKYNGVEKVVFSICKNLDKNKFDVIVLTGKNVDSRLEKEFKDNNIKIVKLNNDKHLNPIGYYKDFLKYINKDIDIIHIHSNSSTVVIELLLSLFKGIKKRIVHCHSNSSNNKFIHYLLKPFVNLFMTYGLACSNDVKKWQFYNKSQVLFNGINTKDFIFNNNNRKKIRQKYDINENEYLYGMIARFSDTKNHEFIINLLRENNDKSIKILFVGDGPLEEKIKDLVKKYKLDNQIIFAGVTNNVNEYYSAFDGFILPSKFEGLGIVLIEAQYNGLPCIVSEAIHDDAIISNLVKKINLDDYKSWIEMLELKEKNTDRNVMLKSKYDIKDNVLELEKVYDKIIKEK